jgi:hypothetical protein
MKSIVEDNSEKNSAAIKEKSVEKLRRCDQRQIESLFTKKREKNKAATCKEMAC